MNLDLIIAVISIIGYTAFIIYTRKLNNFENYAVAGRSVGPLLLFMSMSALFTGPGWTLGLTQQGFTQGYFPMLVASFYGLGKIIEGSVIAPKLRDKFTEAYSIGEVIGGPKSHNSKMVRILAGIISVGLVVGFSVIMSKAAGEILNNFLGISKTLGTVIVTGVVIIYSIFGGLRTSMLTDAVQFGLFIILIPLLAILAIKSPEFSTSSFIENAKSLTATSFNNETSFTIFGLMATWFLGEMMVPPTVSGILASKNSNTAKKAITLSGILMIFWLGLMLSIGLISKTVMGDIPGNDQVLLALGQQYYFPGLFGLFAVALVGVVMSTQDSLLNSASVVFTKDVLNVFKNLSEKKSYLYSRIACVMFGIASIAFASYIPTIISGLLFFYSIWVPSILVALLFSIFLNDPNWKSALSSMIFGILSSVIWSQSSYTEYFPAILFGLFWSLIAYLIVHFLYRN